MPTRSDPVLTAVEAGTALAPWNRAAEFGAWNRYAAVNDEFIPIHMDHEAARDAGMPAAFGMGNLLIAWAHAYLHRAFGEDAAISDFAIRFRKPAYHGAVVLAGTVRDVGEGHGAVSADIDLDIRDAAGDALASSSATVRLAGPGHAGSPGR